MVTCVCTIRYFSGYITHAQLKLRCDHCVTLFSRSCEIPFKADLFFKLFLFCVFSVVLVTLFSDSLSSLFVSFCSFSLCSLATVRNAFSTYNSTHPQISLGSTYHHKDHFCMSFKLYIYLTDRANVPLVLSCPVLSPTHHEHYCTSSPLVAEGEKPGQCLGHHQGETWGANV